MVSKLEKVLEGPSVSQSLGKKAITIINNLLDASPAALSQSANRFKLHACPKIYILNNKLFKLFQKRQNSEPTI